MQIDNSTRWLIAAFAAGLASLFITFFLEGDVRTFAYAAVGMGFALFAVIQSQNDDEKKKRGDSSLDQ